MCHFLAARMVPVRPMVHGMATADETNFMLPTKPLPLLQRNVTLLVGTTEFYVLTLQAARLTACSSDLSSPDIIL
jgi:hypothetical protein